MSYKDPKNLIKVRDFMVEEVKVEPRMSIDGVVHFENERIIDPREHYTKQEQGDELSEYYTVHYSGHYSNESYEGLYQFAVPFLMMGLSLSLIIK